MRISGDGDLGRWGSREMHIRRCGSKMRIEQIADEETLSVEP
jgi:hypothetical protein